MATEVKDRGNISDILSLYISGKEWARRLSEENKSLRYIL